MPIYTKTGDSGTTSLFGGRRLLKSDLRVNAYGEVDELSSFIGLLITRLPSQTDKKFLTEIQNNLYIIMSLLSGAPLSNNRLGQGLRKLEKRIDAIEKKIPKLSRFILPQGTEASALAHVVRTVARRTERAVVFVQAPPIIIKYLNRLSDYFFVLARLHNKKDVFARR